jgi:hypothetical protein
MHIKKVFVELKRKKPVENLAVALPHCHCGNAAIAARLFFLRMRGFFKNGWHFKDVFRDFEVFLK